MKQLKPSPTVAISAKAHLLSKEGIKVYNFGVGDPILPNHPAILDAAAQVLKEKMCPYAPISGIMDLRKLAAEWMNRRYQSQYTVEQTIVTCGGKFGIYAALQLFIEQGEEALVPAPYWVSYPEMVRIASGIPVIVPTTFEGGWKLTPSLLKAHITPKTRVLLLNNAGNPTGILYTREELGAILDVAAEANLTIISDEVYSELTFDGGEFVSCASFPEHRSRVVVIESCSKNFAMAGWRVGFAFAPAPVISNISALQSQSTTGTSFTSQKAAVGALLHADEVSGYVRKAMGHRRTLFYSTFNRLFSTHIKPAPAALYFFSKIGADSIKTCEKLLDEARVAAVPGIGFGTEGYARFAFTESEEDIVKGLEALQKAWRPN
ncbi:MAG: aminotransferase class I/II-fold pyridoxal phosphate-dependent enzyme [Verrucomicrobia bacterium]|nr:aminotransferase class I/II-fold pyridoxal phosphate-dependent enzyme [Verrucomicrobiota bacterium]